MTPALIPESAVQEAIEREFECHRCGNCCKGEGLVRIGRAEADRLAEFLGLTRRQFLRRYALGDGVGHWRLIEQANPEMWCIFLEQDEEGNYACRVNSVKPDQCRSFPAKWRNEDSYRTCAGLKALLRKLRSGDGSNRGEDD